MKHSAFEDARDGMFAGRRMPIDVIVLNPIVLMVKAGLIVLSLIADRRHRKHEWHTTN